jgi:hypothetical protein
MRVSNAFGKDGFFGTFFAIKQMGLGVCFTHISVIELDYLTWAHKIFIFFGVNH